MYNGVGLQTPRGSATTGHIATNKFSLPKSRNYRQNAAVLEKPEPRSASVNSEILEHERKRRIEVKLLVLEEKLTDHGYSDVEIAQKVAEARRNISGDDIC